MFLKVFQNAHSVNLHVDMLSILLFSILIIGVECIKCNCALSKPLTRTTTPINVCCSRSIFVKFYEPGKQIFLDLSKCKVQIRPLSIFSYPRNAYHSKVYFQKMNIVCIIAQMFNFYIKSLTSHKIHFTIHFIFVQIFL